MAINYPIVFKVDDKGLKDAESALGKFSKAAGAIATTVGVAVAGIAAVSVKEFAKFDQALTQSTAIMGDLSDEMVTKMSDAAREVGKTTTFSAEQAAESFYFLASAGLDAAASVEAMPAVAQFAQAGMFDMALATDLLTDAQSALGLAVKDDAVANMENMVRVSDVLARASQLANASIEQFSTSLTTKAGTALKTVGKDVEEGAAALAVFADQGVKGEIAGTQLTNTIFGLTDRAKKAPAQFEALGISVFDASGEMRNFADIADDFAGAMGDMTTEQKLSTLAQMGFTKQARNGLLLMIDNGDALRSYEEQLRSAGGTTQEVAQNQLMTPAAQFQLLGASLNDVALELGSVLTPALGDMAGALTPLVNNFLPYFSSFLNEKIRPGIESLTERFKNFSAEVREGSFTMSDVIDNILEAVTNFFTGDGLTNLLESFVEIRQKLIQAFIEVIPSLVDALVELLPALIEVLAGMIPELLTAAVETFNALVDAVVEVLPVLLEAILDMLPDIVATIIEMLPEVITAGIELFNGLIEALVDVLPELLQAILDTAPDIIDAILDALPQIIEAGFDLFSGLISGLIDATPDILDAIIELIPQMVDELLANIPKLVNAGYELLKGLVKGIKDNIPSLIGQAVSSVGSSLVNGVKDFLNISSPSKVFVGIGEDVVAGLEQGLGAGKRALEGASVSMASTVKVSAMSELDSFGMTRSSMPIASNTSSMVGSPINITVNAGMGSDGQRIGEQIVEEIIRYEKLSGRVFVRA